VAAYKLLIKESARKELEAASPKTLRQLLVKRIQALAENPRGHGSEKLAGHADRYRVRQGRYRVVYRIDDALGEVTIFKIGDRKDVYR
jgi:mRNA interferase RelE/StbE